MDGILIVDKPEGFTSFDVIAKLRGVLGERRLGHGGTLDPMATGVLPVFAGAATKAVDLLPDATKRYTVRVQIGARTDSGDRTGVIVETSAVRPSLEAVREAAASMLGRSGQVPPMVSAVRVNGKRLYELAREGKTVERAARPIEIFACEVSAFDAGAGAFTLDVACSKGTYIRTLAENLLAKCGALGHLTALRRTESAGFSLALSHTLDEIAAAAAAGETDALLLGVESAFASLPVVEPDGNLARLFLNGFRFEASRLPVAVAEGALVRVRRDGVFLGLGAAENGLFIKKKQFWFERL